MSKYVYAYHSQMFVYYDRGWKDGFYCHTPSGFSPNPIIYDGEVVVTKDGMLSQASIFASPYNDFDVAGVGPLLSTGKHELPVHHIGRRCYSYPTVVDGVEVKTYQHTDASFYTALSTGQLPPSGRAVSDTFIGTARASLFIDSFQLAGLMGTHLVYDAAKNSGVLEYYIRENGKYRLSSRCTSEFDGSEWVITAHESITNTDYQGVGHPWMNPIDVGGPLRPLPTIDHSLSLTGYQEDISTWYVNTYLQAAKQAYQYDVNNLENIFSAKETAGLIKLSSWIPRSGQSILKWIAGTYLAYSYGVRPLVSDALSSLELVAQASVGDYLPSRVVNYSSARFGDMECHLKVCLTNPGMSDQFAQTAARAAKASVELSAKNLWDLVPWSFVVDWLFPIGDMLEKMSSFNDSSRRWDFEYASLSRKRASVICEDSRRVELTAYDRHILDKPPSRVSVMNSARGSGINVPSAIALAINLFL